MRSILSSSSEFSFLYFLFKSSIYLLYFFYLIDQKFSSSACVIFFINMSFWIMGFVLILSSNKTLGLKFVPLAYWPQGYFQNLWLGAISALILAATWFVPLSSSLTVHSG